MRFSAFNFADMKKSTIWVLGIVMGLSFLSLLYLQVSYIEEMVKMRKGQFDESVQRSLVQACRNIELVETKKYLEDDAIATEKAAQLSREQAEEKKGEGSGNVVRRKQTFEFKKGGNWISITENAVKYLLQYKEIVLNRMKYTLCADEIFIQTILWNSPFRERMHCTNNANTGSMREIDWEHGSPYIWQDHDYQTLINSNKIFARKFNSNQMGIVYKIQKLYLKQVPK